MLSHSIDAKLLSIFSSASTCVKQYTPSKYEVGLGLFVAGLTTYKLWKLKNALQRTNPDFPTTRIEKAAQWVAVDLVEALDGETENIDDLLERVDPTSDCCLETTYQPGDRPKVAAALATLVKLEVGLLKPTTANKMVVQRMITKIMRARFMRPRDQIRVLPYAVSLVFLPTADDVLDRETRHAERMRARMIRSNRSIQLERSWTEWFWGCSANRGALEFINN